MASLNLKEKVELIRTELSLDAALKMKAVLEEAHEQLDTDPGGNLNRQADTILVALGKLDDAPASSPQPPDATNVVTRTSAADQLGSVEALAEERLDHADATLQFIDAGLDIAAAILRVGSHVPVFGGACAAAKEVLDVVRQVKDKAEDAVEAGRRVVDVLKVLRMLSENVSNLARDKQDELNAEMNALKALLTDMKELIQSFGTKGWLRKAWSMKKHAKTLSRLDKRMRDSVDTLMRMYQLANDAEVLQRLKEEGVRLAQDGRYKLDAAIEEQVSKRLRPGAPDAESAEAEALAALQTDAQLRAEFAAAAGLSRELAAGLSDELAALSKQLEGIQQDVSTLLKRDRVGARVDRVDERQNRLEVEMAELRAATKQAAAPEALPKKPAYKLYLVLQPAPILNGSLDFYAQKLTALTLQIEEDGEQWRETNQFPLCINYGAKATVQTDLPHAHALIWCTRGCVAASDLRNVASYDQDSMSLSALADVSETCALPAVAVVCMKHGAGRAAKKLLELGVEVVAWIGLDVMDLPEQDLPEFFDMLRSVLDALHNTPSEQLQQKVKSSLGGLSALGFTDDGCGSAFCDASNLPLTDPFAEIEQSGVDWLKRRYKQPPDHNLANLRDADPPLEVLSADLHYSHDLRQILTGAAQKKSSFDCVPDDVRHVVLVCDDDQASTEAQHRARAIACSMCYAFLDADKQSGYYGVFRIASASDMEKAIAALKGSPQRSKKLFLWIDLPEQLEDFREAAVAVEEAAKSSKKTRCIVTCPAALASQVCDELLSKLQPTILTMGKAGGIPDVTAGDLHEEIQLVATKDGEPCNLLDILPTHVLEATVDRVLRDMPLVAIFLGDDAACLLRVCVADVGTLHHLRDTFLTGDFDREFNGALQDEVSRVLPGGVPTTLRVQVDRTHFAEMYEASILSLHRLTPHQLSVLNETEGHEKVRLFAPAGAGKTFIGLHRLEKQIREFLGRDRANHSEAWAGARATRGKCDMFGSYKQNDSSDALLMNMYYQLKQESLELWLDKMRGEERSELGMVAGVRACRVFCAVISPAYFQSDFCKLEMQTAIAQQKPIAVCFNGSKFKVQDALSWIPAEFAQLKADELIMLHEDNEFMQVGLKKLKARLLASLPAQPTTTEVPRSRPREGAVLFASKNQELCLFVAKWLIQRKIHPDYKVVLKRLHVLFDGPPEAPLSAGPRSVHVVQNFLETRPLETAAPDYSLVVVDEVHHLITDDAIWQAVQQYIPDGTTFVLLGDVSQSLGKDLPWPEGIKTVHLTEVVRSSKRIITAASAFQLNDASSSKRKEETKCHHQSDGPPLRSFLFEVDEGRHFECYAKYTLSALQRVVADFPTLSLHDRLAIVVPDDVFLKGLRPHLHRLLKDTFSDGGVERFELVSGKRASSCVASVKNRPKSEHEWLVFDEMRNFDGLERLIVVAVGLDAVIDAAADGDETLETRSRLYRALTRAHMMVFVVNEVVVGGWLEFLTKVTSAKAKFDDEEERRRLNAEAAQNIVNTALRQAVEEQEELSAAAKEEVRKIVQAQDLRSDEAVRTAVVDVAAAWLQQEEELQAPLAQAAEELGISLAAEDEQKLKAQAVAARRKAPEPSQAAHTSEAIDQAVREAIQTQIVPAAKQQIAKLRGAETAALLAPAVKETLQPGEKLDSAIGSVLDAWQQEETETLAQLKVLSLNLLQRELSESEADAAKLAVAQATRRGTALDEAVKSVLVEQVFNPEATIAMGTRVSADDEAKLLLPAVLDAAASQKLGAAVDATLFAWQQEKEAIHTSLNKAAEPLGLQLSSLTADEVSRLMQEVEAATWGTAEGSALLVLLRAHRSSDLSAVLDSIRPRLDAAAHTEVLLIARRAAVERDAKAGLSELKLGAQQEEAVMEVLQEIVNTTALRRKSEGELSITDVCRLADPIIFTVAQLQLEAQEHGLHLQPEDLTQLWEQVQTVASDGVRLNDHGALESAVGDVVQDHIQNGVGRAQRAVEEAAKEKKLSLKDDALRKCAEAVLERMRKGTPLEEAARAVLPTAQNIWDAEGNSTSHVAAELAFDPLGENKKEEQMGRLNGTMVTDVHPKEVGRVQFVLRGKALAAIDRGTFHRNGPSSDPFYVLKAKDASTGKMVQLAKSKHINETLNPQWEAVEVDAQQLANVQELQIEVWSHDPVLKNDLIGEATFALPDIFGAFRSGAKQFDLPPLPLQERPDRWPAGENGTVEGLVILERKKKEIAPVVKLGHVTFSLRGKGLAAMDTNLFSKSSSDPFYKLHARRADGGFTEVGTSNVIMKTLDPRWDALEVAAEKLHGATSLKVEVWDYDVAIKNNLIGEATFALPDIFGAFRSGANQFDLPPLPLLDPVHPSRPAGENGTVEGLVILERIGRTESVPDAESSTQANTAPPVVILSSLDDRLVAVLERGDIRLLRVKWVEVQPEEFKIQRRQALEALQEEIEKHGGLTPLLGKKEAADLVRSGKREAGALSYGWILPWDPDPTGERTKLLRQELSQRPYIKGLFWDQATLYQPPRTEAQQASFERALEVMMDLYASAIGTTVLQIKDIPIRPPEYDGLVCLGGVPDGTSEAAIKEALQRFGKIQVCAAPEQLISLYRVKFAIHAVAEEAVVQAPKQGLCKFAFIAYNSRPYDDLDAGGEGRGWCVCENDLCGELVTRLNVSPKMKEVLASLPPKMIRLSPDAQPQEINPQAGNLASRVSTVKARLRKATFTKESDSGLVPGLYEDYVKRIAGVLQATLPVAAQQAAAPAAATTPAEVKPTKRPSLDQLLKGVSSLEEQPSEDQLSLLSKTRH